MAKLDSLTGRGATRVMLSVFEGMGRSVKEEREGNGVRRGSRKGRREPAGSHDHVSHADCCRLVILANLTDVKTNFKMKGI
jgi:hypothetical protein